MVYATTMFLFSGVDDIHEVRSAVEGLAGRWKYLGDCLRVRSNDLDTIQSNNPHSSTDCLREMLLKWLKQSYNVCTMLILHSPSFDLYYTKSTSFDD